MFNLSAIYAYVFFYIYIHTPLMRLKAKSFHSAGASGSNTKIIAEKKSTNFFNFWEFQKKFGLLFFMWVVLRKLDKFSGRMCACPQLTGEVANTYPLHLRPSGLPVVKFQSQSCKKCQKCEQ